MGDRQSARHFAQQARFLVEVELRRKTVEREAFDQFHDNRRRIGFVEHRKNRDDGRVIERGGVARFIEYATADRLVGAVAQDFDRHAPVEFFVVRGINYAQAAFAEFAFNAEARQARRGFFAGRRGAFRAGVPLPHVQAGLDAFARFPPDSFRQ